MINRSIFQSERRKQLTPKKTLRTVKIALQFARLASFPYGEQLAVQGVYPLDQSVSHFFKSHVN